MSDTPLERDLTFVRTMNTSYVMCRSMRHAWDLEYFGVVEGAPYPVTTIFSASAIIRVTQCIRCGTRKEDFFGLNQAQRVQTGEPLKAFYRRYRHPDRYLWKRSDTNEVDRPLTYDFTEELYNRYQTGALDG